MDSQKNFWSRLHWYGSMASEMSEVVNAMIALDRVCRGESRPEDAGNLRVLAARMLEGFDGTNHDQRAAALCFVDELPPHAKTTVGCAAFLEKTIVKIAREFRAIANGEVSREEAARLRELFANAIPKLIATTSRRRYLAF